MQVSVELLFHYRCDLCQQWWSVADIRPTIGASVHCPHCGERNKVEDLMDGEQKKIQWLSDRADWDFDALSR